MTAAWMCSHRDNLGQTADPTPHDTEAQAMAHADELAARGLLAVVYQVEVD